MHFRRIINLKEELDHKYFKIRQVRRNLRSQIHDVQVQNDLEKTVIEVSVYHFSQKEA